MTFVEVRKVFSEPIAIGVCGPNFTLKFSIKEGKFILKMLWKMKEVDLVYQFQVIWGKLIRI